MLDRGCYNLRNMNYITPIASLFCVSLIIGASILRKHKLARDLILVSVFLVAIGTIIVNILI